jgi:hypothetical protein
MLNLTKHIISCGVNHIKCTPMNKILFLGQKVRLDLNS